MATTASSDPVFVLLTGPAGSGKSTAAAAWAARGTGPRALLDVDQLRALIRAGLAHPEHGWTDGTERQWTIGTEVCSAMARVYKSHGVSVIIDVYAPPWPGDPWSRLLDELGGTLVTLFPSVEVCLARNTARARQPFLVDADLRANYDDFAECVVLHPPDHMIDTSNLTVDQVVQQIQAIVDSRTSPEHASAPDSLDGSPDADSSTGMTPLDPRTLWRVQLALEGKSFDPDSGRLVETPSDDPDGLASCYVVSYPDGGSEVAFAAEAPAQFVDQFRQLSVEDVKNDPDAIAHRFSTERVMATAGHYHTYCFEQVANPCDLDVTQHGSEQFSITVNGVYAAGASSSRSNSKAAELWIETEPDYRRRGYATALAGQWAQAIQSTGRTAFYSHHHDNDASRALAQRLAVRPLFELVGITLNPVT